MEKQKKGKIFKGQSMCSAWVGWVFITALYWFSDDDDQDENDDDSKEADDNFIKAHQSVVQLAGCGVT